jgi:hypothetical protein
MGMFKSTLLKSEIKGYPISENLSFSNTDFSGNGNSKANEGPFDVQERTALTLNGPNVYGTASCGVEMGKSSAIAGELFRGVLINDSDEPMPNEVTVNLVYKLETSVDNPMLEKAEAGVGFRLLVTNDDAKLDLLEELGTSEDGISVLMEETQSKPGYFLATDVLKNSGTDSKEVTINRSYTFLVPPKKTMKFEFASTSFGRIIANAVNSVDKQPELLKV